MEGAEVEPATSSTDVSRRVKQSLFQKKKVKNPQTGFLYERSFIVIYLDKKKTISNSINKKKTYSISENLHLHFQFLAN